MALGGKRMEKLVCNVKTMREKTGLTQKQLADHLGVSLSCVSAWEVGRNVPRIDMLYKMSRVFNRKIEDIYSEG